MNANQWDAIRQLDENDSPVELAAAIGELLDEYDRLATRRDELLATIARISQSTPLDSEVAEALEQRGKLLAEIGTLRAQLAAAKASEEEAWTSRRAYFSQRNDNMRTALERIAVGLPAHESGAIAAASLAEYHRMRERPKPPADDESRCAVCQWPLAETAEKGCVRGNCSMRPLPANYYAPERAARELADMIRGVHVEQRGKEQS